PWAEQPAPGTLSHPAQKIHTSESLLMPAFSLAPPPPKVTPRLHRTARRSPTHQRSPRRTTIDAATSAVYLSPATLSAQNHLTSELLRTLSRMAASKPTSWLSQQLHILSHSAHA